ncbi:WhiB family transcriptional regulator [Pseudonocardia nigra]|uniref:WhiB family transcriptional regulator n=1 Tax=Pseudonocardia nigra TaxID=1921578 RepID=UPI003557010B
MTTPSRSTTNVHCESVAGHVRPEDFRHRAACRDADAEVFFPAAEQGPEHDAQVRAAKAVCARCPVRAECLTWALDAQPYGIAGGLTEYERREERARRGRGRACRVRQRPASGTPGEVAAAGREAIRAGLDPREVAREFGVTERTATRWVAQTRAGTSTDCSTSEGSRGGNRAPLGTSHTRNPQAGTRAAEGHRS